MALKPIIIRRSTLVKKTNDTHELVSTVFHAEFANQKGKSLHFEQWQPLGLRKERTLQEVGEEVMLMSECCLYYKDWSDNPTLGGLKINYPKTIAQ